MPKYPDLRVPLIGEDGNAFTILGKSVRALRKYGLDREELKAFEQEAKSGDYNQLLRTCHKWFTITDQQDNDLEALYVL